MNQILGQTEKIIQPFFRCQYKGRILLLLNATNSNLKILEDYWKAKKTENNFLLLLNIRTFDEDLAVTWWKINRKRKIIPQRRGRREK